MALGLDLGFAFLKCWMPLCTFVPLFFTFTTILLNNNNKFLFVFFKSQINFVKNPKHMKTDNN